MHNLLSSLMQSFYSSFVILAISLGMSGVATAQETSATTPPELREFRLDPKPEAKPVEPAPAALAGVEAVAGGGGFFLVCLISTIVNVTAGSLTSAFTLAVTPKL